MLIKWEGWNNQDSKTWEQVETLHADVARMVADFLQTSAKRNLKLRILE